MASTVSLHRILKASPEKVFRAFTNATAIASWLPPYGFLCTFHEMKAEKGGTFRMSFTNFSTGNGHSFGGTYVDVKPNEFLKYTDRIVFSPEPCHEPDREFIDELVKLMSCQTIEEQR